MRIGPHWTFQAFGRMLVILARQDHGFVMASRGWGMLRVENPMHIQDTYAKRMWNGLGFPNFPHAFVASLVADKSAGLLLEIDEGAVVSKDDETPNKPGGQCEKVLLKRSFHQYLIPINGAIVHSVKRSSGL